MSRPAFLRLFRKGVLCILFLLSLMLSTPSNTTITARPTQTQNPEQWQQDVKRLEAEAAQLQSQRKYDQAIVVLTRALELREKAVGPNALDVAEALSALGEVSYAAGNYDGAIGFMSRALAIREKALPPDDPLIAESSSDLAALYVRKGDLITPEPMLRRALSIQEKRLGPNSLDVARTLNSLATLYDERGDRKTAEPLFKRSLAIREKELGEKDRLVANSLNNLARLYMANRDFENAEPLYRRSLRIREEVLGPDDPQLAPPILNLATLYYEKGEFAEAEKLFLRALRLQEKGLSANHPALINTLHNLAEVYRHQSRFNEAESLYKRSLEVALKSLGPAHSQVAVVLRGYALLEEARGDFNAAASFLKRAIDIQEHNLSLMLTAGSQSQKLLYLRTVTDETDLALSLHLRNSPGSADIARLALTTILQRKGRVLDVMSASIELLRQGANPEDLALINQLAEARDQLAKLTFSPPAQGTKDVETQTRELENKIAEKEAEISIRSSRFRSQTQLVTLDRVQHAVPANSCLIEFVSYRPFDVTGKTQSESFGPLRYAAYILKSDGAPSWVSLGDAAKIDRAVEQFRKSLANPSNISYRKAGRSLDELLMRPVRRFAGSKQQLLISPDGALNLIPFAALIDERGRYLAQRYVITYLSSGRDLLRLQARAATNEKPVVVANPVFDETIASQQPSATSAPRKTRGAVDFSKITITPLPETAVEAESFKTLFPDAIVFTGINATEAAIKKVTGPNIFHAATHGFFLSSMTSSSGTRGVMIAPNEETTPGGDPLLRSGLLLAGASLGDSGSGEDGILTALEVANLNLWGTKLVVLSACETGLGDVYIGEGVFGLRRALVLAGAESQVISLWKVSDRATRELMVSYYRLLQRGAGRADALREVQRKMINARYSDRKFTHPYYWASFIQSGEWQPMYAK